MILLYESDEVRMGKKIIVYSFGYITITLILIGLIWILYNVFTNKQLYLLILIPPLLFAIIIINSSPKDLLTNRIRIYNDKLVVLHNRRLFSLKRIIEEYSLKDRTNISFENNVLIYKNNGKIIYVNIGNKEKLSLLKRLYNISN